MELYVKAFEIWGEFSKQLAFSILQFSDCATKGLQSRPIWNRATFATTAVEQPTWIHLWKYANSTNSIIINSNYICYSRVLKQQNEIIGPRSESAKRREHILYTSYKE